MIIKGLSCRFQIQQLSASLSSDSHTQRVVNLFTQYSMSLQSPPAMHVYESLLSACARSYHLHWAMGIFNTVTGRHAVAPSRNVSFQTLSSPQSSRPMVEGSWLKFAINGTACAGLQCAECAAEQAGSEQGEQGHRRALSPRLSTYVYMCSIG